MAEPLKPRITKSTAVAAIMALFEKPSELLKRFEIAKAEANLWDGERDGLREAVKGLKGGQYDDVILSWSTTAPVMYPNSTGKHQLENCLQISVVAPPVLHKGTERVDGAICAGDPVIVFQFAGDAEQFMEAMLHQLQKGKDVATTWIMESCIGTGEVVKNSELYEKKGADKSTITIMPPEV